VSVKGATRAHQSISTESFWKWIDAHGKEFGIGRPYLDKDPPHLAPIDGKEYAAHHGVMKAQHAGSDMKKGGQPSPAPLLQWSAAPSLLGSIVNAAPSLVGPPVHALRLVGELLKHVRASAQSHSDLL
jgi:hypothetical protein